MNVPPYLWYKKNDQHPGTHALIIGTSKYKNLGDNIKLGPPETFMLTQLSSPAAGAYRFAKWLRSEYRSPSAPIASIRLLLSPSDAEREADADLKNDPDIPLPTTELVRKALLDWQKECSSSQANIAVLYLSGHGIKPNNDDDLILLYDFADDDLVLTFSVDLNKVVRAMVGQNMASNQLYFHDACRLYSDHFGQKYYGPGLCLPLTYVGEGDLRNYPIFRSAATGTAAQASPGNGTLFANALLECLTGSDKSAIVTSAEPKDVAVVSIDSLCNALEAKIGRLAQHLGGNQWFKRAGESNNFLFHIAKSPDSAPDKPPKEQGPRLIPEELLRSRYKLLVDSLESNAMELKAESLGLQHKSIKLSSVQTAIDKLGIDVDFADSLEVVATDIAELMLVQDMRYLGAGWWWWTVWLDGPAGELRPVRGVSYELHESFPQRKVTVKNAKTKFALEHVGWGEFEIIARVQYKSGSQKVLKHWLMLVDDMGKRCQR
jgi:hypothetical protein